MLRNGKVESSLKLNMKVGFVNALGGTTFELCCLSYLDVSLGVTGTAEHNDCPLCRDAGLYQV